MRSDNAIKTPLFASLTALARQKAQDQAELAGRGWPCQVVSISGAIVTVKFLVNTPFTIPQVEMPKAESPYHRDPTQIDDLGYAVPGDVYLGGVSGLGGGEADLSQRGNLAALVFHPISSFNSPPPNQTQAISQGPGGFLGRTMDGAVFINLTETAITLSIGNSTLVMAANQITLNSPQIVLNGQLTQGQGGEGGTATFQGPVTVIEELTANGIPLSTHLHSDAGGIGDSGPPIP